MTPTNKRRVLLGLGLFMVYWHSIYFAGLLVPEERYFFPLLNDVTAGERLLSLLMALPFALGFLMAVSGRAISSRFILPITASLAAGLGLSLWRLWLREPIATLLISCRIDYYTEWFAVFFDLLLCAVPVVIDIAEIYYVIISYIFLDRYVLVRKLDGLITLPRGTKDHA